VERNEELADLSSLVPGFNRRVRHRKELAGPTTSECQHARSIRHRWRKIVAWRNGASTPEFSSASPTIPARLRDIAAFLGITERSVFGIVTELTTAGYVIKDKDGRRNRYRVGVTS
jgi:hypothetical protein